MIKKALTFLQDELNSYLQGVHGVATDVAQLGSSASDDMNKPDVEMCLVSIEEERVAKEGFERIKVGRNWVTVNPTMHFNLYLLISANANDYEKNLMNVSEVISFFQSKSVFLSENYPLLGGEKAIEKLVVEWFNQDAEQQNDLWSKLGKSYTPSACYKIRLVSVQNVRDPKISAEINELSLDLNGKNS